MRQATQSVQIEKEEVDEVTEVEEAEIVEEEIETEEEWEEIQMALNPDLVWSSLDEALSEMGYDMYHTAKILASGKLPPDLVSLVAKKVSNEVELVRPMLEAQCPLMLPKVLKLIEIVERQLELQRIAQEEIERADAAEKLLLIEKERQRQKEAIMERVAMIGRCPAGYEWRREGSGYYCMGGSHFVSDSMINLQFEDKPM